MPLSDYLKGYEPNLNVDDSGFEPIKYKGEAVINVLREEVTKFGERVNMELEIPDGDFKGRRLWKRYDPNNEEQAKRLVDDLFTAGLPYDFSTEDAQQATFGSAIGKVVHVRAYPFRNYMVDGKFLSSDERNALTEEEKAEFPMKQAVRIIKAPSDARKPASLPF